MFVDDANAISSPQLNRVLYLNEINDKFPKSSKTYNIDRSLLQSSLIELRHGFKQISIVFEDMLSVLCVKFRLVLDLMRIESLKKLAISYFLI